MTGSKRKDSQASLISMGYVLLYMGLASWMSFFNIYLEEIGFSGLRIGAINGIYWSTMVFVVPIWGLMADRFGTRKILFFVAAMAIVLVFFMGFIASFAAPLNMFINLYFTGIGGDSRIVGVNFAVQSFSELPFFFIAYRLIRRHGEIRILIFTMAITVARLFMYGIISDPVIALPLAITHGITFSMFLVVMVEYVQKRVEPYLRATGQSLIWAFHFDAGLTIGNILIGWLKDLVGMQDVMKLAAAGIVIVIAAIIVFIRE